MIVCNRVRESRLPPGHLQQAENPGLERAPGFFVFGVRFTGMKSAMDPEPQLALAALLAQRGRQEDALNAYLSAGACFFNRGDTDQALGCWTKAVEIRP